MGIFGSFLAGVARGLFPQPLGGYRQSSKYCVYPAARKNVALLKLGLSASSRWTSSTVTQSMAMWHFLPAEGCFACWWASFSAEAMRT